MKTHILEAGQFIVFIAQLGEHCSANAEATGSNPVEAPKNVFPGYFCNCLNCDSLRRSHTHFIVNTVGSAMDQLSTKVRPNQKHKTDRPDLDGKGVDIHKWIGKIPRPKAGFTPGKYKFMGPYNPLEKELEYDPETGEVLKWKVMPYNKVDEIAAYHDICYDMGRNKGECDREMIKSLDQRPYGEMPKWGSTARFLINTEQKLGLGVNSKNEYRR